MKLIKLLPLAGMTGIAAIAAPLLSSCQKGTEMVWNKGEELPTLPAPSQTEFESQEEATDAYFTAIDEDNTLLSKDIIHGIMKRTDASSTFTKVSVRTDSVDKEKHLISVYTIEASKTLDDVNTYEAKNVEYVINRDTAGIVYFQPAIMLEVELAQKAYQHREENPEAFVKAVGVVMNHAEELARDKSWFFYYEIKTTGRATTQRIDYSNIYEYAYNVVPTYDISLSYFKNASEYFKDIKY